MGALVRRAMLKVRLALILSLAVSGASAAFDPTEPPKLKASSGAESARDASDLAWVRVNGPRSIAWYGGIAVKLGDQVEGGRVTAIREDHIVISGKNGRRAVYLLDHSIRTPLRGNPDHPGESRN